MFIRLFFALLALLGVMWFMSWYGKAAPEDRNRAVKTGLLYALATILLVLVVTGRIPVIFAAISAAIPFIHRLLAYRGLLGTLGRFAGQKFGPTTLTTAWLVVQLDIARRAMDATVIQGQFMDRKLSQLSNSELDLLLDEVKEDFQSRAAVNAYIMAKKGQTYQQNTPPPSSRDGKMTVSQAYEILGLNTTASEDEIKHAHKRLIQKLHPDRGGSSYLAAQINDARDTLLNRHV